MKLSEEIAIYEHETFGCTADEYKRKIEDSLKEKGLNYTIGIIQYDAKKETEWISAKDYDESKVKLDKNYTYTIGTTYIENGIYKRVVLYVSIYKDDINQALFVYNKKAIMYRDKDNFPKRYKSKISELLKVIEPYRI